MISLNVLNIPRCSHDVPLVHVPNFGGLSGSEDRGGGDNTIQFINFGRVDDKSFKEWRQKKGGGRVGDNNILTFSSSCTR